MAINTKTFTAVVQDMATAIQSSMNALQNFNPGSVLLAIVQGVASAVVWLQSLILSVLASSRASTSVGPDLDSWMADFDFYRLSATYSVGVVTFSRYTNSVSATIPVGQVVQTGDGTQSFSVTADTNNIYYSAANGGQYVVPVGITSINVPVRATVAGSSGNVSANSINVISGAISGVDSVTNASSTVNGSDVETDANFLARFQAYINSLSMGTKQSIESTVNAISPGTVCKVTENLTYAGLTDYDFFYAVVDDGTGTPSSALLTSATNVIDSIRPVTSRFSVYPPVVVNAVVVLTVIVAAGYNHSTISAEVVTAITNYINSIPLGGDLYLTKIAQIAYEADVGIVNVTGITINGVAADLILTDQQVVKASTITVN